ncbi:MAG: acyltransferase [Bacilli bacterium]
MPYSMITRPEMNELNVLRALAFLAVVLQSALSVTNGLGHLGTADAIIVGLVYDAAKFSAPVFIFLTGYAIIAHGTTLSSYVNYVTKKGREIVLPYIVWSVVYFYLFHLNSEDNFLVQLLAGEAAPHMWYVIMVFQYHLLAPFFLFLFDIATRHVTTRLRLGVVIALVALVYVALLFWSWTSIYNGKPITETDVMLYIDRSFFAYAFYFVLGGVLARSKRSFRSFTLKMVPANSFLFFILYFYVNYQLFNSGTVLDLNLKVSTYLKPSMFFYVVSVMLLLYALSLVIVNTRTQLKTVLEFISRYTYIAYLSHFACIIVVSQLLRYFGLHHLPILYAALLFIGASAGAVFIGWCTSPDARVLLRSFTFRIGVVRERVKS